MMPFAPPKSTAIFASAVAAPGDQVDERDVGDVAVAPGSAINEEK
jgi:hypothetical protein